MPKDRETSNHPCHFLSLPSAKRFWCRHCMSVFEDAITRWRHSRTCRYGVVTNFMRRRELEAKALQNTTKPNLIEARLEQSVETPAISSTGISNVESASSSQNGGLEDKDSLFRCFICQSQFSTLEEMRHHVKFPCNHKKTETEESQAAVTVYIDEFTDRSRPWDPAPQPQQEEVYTSEFVSSVDHPQTVHANLEVTTESDNAVISTPVVQKQENITPTNIYVNEQGETVIEVENLDINSEVGELSLAHLLTQLSQQGIVFDKTKTGHMQARQEMTVSDPSSGKIYAASSLNYPSLKPGISQEDDEGQPTAEDAANTLAQLAGFRGFRNSQEFYDGTQIVTNQAKQDTHIIETSQSYEYAHTAGSSTTNENQMNVDTHGNEAQFKVNYEYEYYPSTQAASSTSGQHLALQSIVPQGAQEYDNDSKIEEEIVHHFPVQFYEDGSTSQRVTYITTQEDQQTDVASIQNLKQDGIDVDGQRVIIDNGSGPVIIQQYAVEESEPTSTQFVNFPVQLPVSEGQVTQEIFHTDPNSGQPLNKVDNSQEILCHPNRNVSEATTILDVNAHGLSHHAENSTSHKSDTSNNHSEQIVKISTFPASDGKETDNTEEFAIQTVSLQEIVEADSSNPISFVDRNEVISTQEALANSQVVHSDENTQFHTVTLDTSANQNTTIHSIDARNLESITNPDLALTNKFVIAETDEHHTTLEHNVTSTASRPQMPVFVVSSSGLQLVSADQKNIAPDTRTGL